MRRLLVAFALALQLALLALNVSAAFAGPGDVDAVGPRLEL